jgi:transposase
MSKKRTYTPEYKAQVVLEILSQQKSLAQASREYGIRDTVISRWKQEFADRLPQLFERGQDRDERDQRIAELERMVGRLTMELEVSKKVSSILGSQ